MRSRVGICFGHDERSDSPLDWVGGPRHCRAVGRRLGVGGPGAGRGDWRARRTAANAPGAQFLAHARRRHARRAALAPEFRSFPLRQSRRQERRPPARRSFRNLRQPKSVQHQGGLDRARAGRQCLPDTDGPLAGRALHLLRADRALHRPRRGPRACDLPSRPARAFLRRRPAHLGGRAVFLRSSENQRPTAATRRLQPGQIDRRAGRADGALRSERRGRPRIAAHPRADAGSAQTRHGRGAFPGRDARAAGRLRALYHNERAARRAAAAAARSRLLGQGRSEPARLL